MSTGYYRPSRLIIAALSTSRSIVAPVVAGAHGRVLEIGVGSGLNFPLYGEQVELVYGIDPSPRLLGNCAPACRSIRVPVELLLGSATAIHLRPTPSIPL